MENPTPFSLNEAIRRWRAEFGSQSFLNSLEVEELEGHLRDHVAQLEAGGMSQEAAFAMAAKQLGDRQRVAIEFAKINPQRIWLERAIWIAVGFILLCVMTNLASIPGTTIIVFGYSRQWNPVVSVVMTRVCILSALVSMAAVLLLLFRQKPRWRLGLGRCIEQRPLWGGIGIVLLLLECTWLRNNWRGLFESWLPQAAAWLFPTVHAPFPDWSATRKISMICSSVEDVIWAIALCVLAARVVRERERFRLTTGRQGIATLSPWLERVMWIFAGFLLLRLGFPVSEAWVMLPAHWLVSASRASTAVQHLVGFVTAALGLVLWVAPFWACWRFGRGLSWLGDNIYRALRDRPFWASVGITLLLNANLLPWWLFRWVGLQDRLYADGPNQIIVEWNCGSWMVSCNYVTLAVLLVLLVRWRTMLRAAC